jgi:hypothetical protein
VALRICLELKHMACRLGLELGLNLDHMAPRLGLNLGYVVKLNHLYISKLSR